MADSPDTGTGASFQAGHPEHGQTPPTLAGALKAAADAHNAIGDGHKVIAAHLNDAADAATPDDTAELTGDEMSDDDSDDATRTMPRSAAARSYQFPAGSGAAKSLRAMTSGRRG